MPRALQARLRQSVLLAVIVVALAMTVPTAGAATADTSQNESSSGNVTLYRASDVALDDATAVEVAIEDGTIEPAKYMITGETLVVQIESERLANDLAARNNSTTTARFFAALDDDAALPIVYPDPGPSFAPLLFQLSPDDTTVYRTGTTTYVLINTGAVDVKWEDKGTHTPEAKLYTSDPFSVTFGYNISETAANGPVIVFYPTEAEFVEYGGARRTNWTYGTLPPEVINQPVKVYLEPEESLAARLTFENERVITAPVEPVDWTQREDVWRAHREYVSLDLRNVETNQNYTLELVHDGTVVDQINGTVLEPNASLRDAELTDRPHIGYEAGVNVVANLSHGGAVIVFDEACQRIGNSEFSDIEIRPDSETELTIGLGEEPTESLLIRAYREQGSYKRVYAGPTAEITVGPGSIDCPAPTPEPTPTPTPESTPTPTPTEQMQTSTTPNNQDTPGFTPTIAAIAVALSLAGGGRRT